jgi:hypothetical protein
MTLFKRIFGFVVAVMLGLSTVAVAQVYYGFNPTTGLNTAQGVPVAAGKLPVVTGTCGTIPAPVGGAGVFQVTTAGVTTCTLIVTLPSAAPNGVYCVFVDETTAADANNMHQASHTSTSCTSNAATIVAGDNILVEVNGF